MFLFFIFSCKKSDELKPRNIKGKYETETFTHRVEYTTCSNSANKVFSTISKPGRIVFTGKKTIQGYERSITNPTYIGYFEYDDLTTKDDFGYEFKFENKEPFQYMFAESNMGDFMRLYYHGIEQELKIEFDEKNNVSKITHYIPVDCGNHVFEHVVKN